MEGGWEDPWWSDIRTQERRKQCLVLKVRYYRKHLKRRRRRGYAEPEPEPERLAMTCSHLLAYVEGNTVASVRLAAMYTFIT